MAENPLGPILAGPLLGAVGPKGFNVWVQAVGDAPLTLEVFDKSGASAGVYHRTPARQDWFCVVFRVTGLPAGMPFDYVLSSTAGETKRFHARTALEPSARRVRIAFGSCLGKPERSGGVLQSIAMLGPDLFLMTGDTAYFENDDVGEDVSAEAAEKAMMATHLKYRRSQGFHHLTSRVATVAIWDDHDYGPNNARAGYTHKDVALRCFKRMWANASYGTTELRGVFSSFRLGPAEIFLLDGRFHRTSKGVLGEAQMDWLLDGLAASSAPVKLVASPSQVLSSRDVAVAETDFDNWRRYGEDEYDRLVSFIADPRIDGVVLVSGDVHLGYLLRRPGALTRRGVVGQDLWELCSSRLCDEPWPHKVIKRHSALVPPLFDPAILCELHTNNFGVIEVDLDRRHEEVRLSLHAPVSGGLFAPVIKQAVPLTSLRPRRITQPKLSAVSWPNGKTYFFRGDRYVRYDVAGRAPDPGYPKDVRAGWNGLEPGFDAVLVWDDGWAYFLKGSGYIRMRVADKRPVLPRGYIARRWGSLPAAFTFDADAAVCWPNGKAYLFRGDSYVRYDRADEHVDEGYPKKIAEGWPGVWDGGIDAIVLDPPSHAIFFRNDEYVRWNTFLDRPEPGFPRKIAGDWPGLP